MVKSPRARPIVQAFLLADGVYEDRQTGKRIIVGTFNRFRVPQFPAVMQGGFVYLNITGLHGATDFELQFRSLDDQRVLMHATVTIEAANDPHARAEAGLPVPGFPVPRPGIYAMDLVWHDVPIATMRVLAEEIPS